MQFDFQKDYILENDNVLLRPLEILDIENLLHFSINEPELWQYSLLPASNESELKHYIQVALEKRNLKTDYPFIVFDKKTNSYAGSTRFYDIQLTNKCLQLGFTWYGKDYQGTGLNKNCKYLLLEFAFEKLNIERVEFRADNSNEKSIAAMKSIGCKIEGILRSNGVRPNGERRDSIILSILKTEWKKSVKENLLKRL
ncbi:GNAT family protein [uncultured Flavobacterium sp.]|uniref:GNAT family N-acetyltransferase n=1 Tax=uncultured Flavobacterium sp. TaxID=165435 RepID=UPI0030C880DA